MTRAVVCGHIFDEAVSVLGLESVEERPQVALVDLADPAAVERACRLDRDLPRIAVGGAEQERLMTALGVTIDLVAAGDPALIGPLIARIGPQLERPATRRIVVSGISGGIGRTLLVTHLAMRLARSASVLVLDATGTGAAGWWLGLSAGAWSDLEGLVDELTGEHLGVLAAEDGRLRLIGGASAMPSTALLAATMRAAGDLADVVVVDAPSLPDERAMLLRDLADRLLVVATDHPLSEAVASLVTLDERVWLIASRSRSSVIAGHAVMGSLPDDPRSLRAALRGPSPVGGALGRAYDGLAELLAVDIS